MEHISSLILACQQGNLAQLQQLIAPNSADILKSTDRVGRSLLHYCCENASVNCAEYLLALADKNDSITSSMFINLQDLEGFSGLLLAVINNDVDMVKILLRKGASVDLYDREHHTAVHWATVCGNFECLDVLLSNGASPSFPDMHGAHPIHYAAQRSAEPISPVANADSSSTASATAVPSSGLQCLKRLIATGINVDPVDMDRRIPLLWAASSGAAEACRLLYLAGSDVTAGDKDGLTALHCAASRGHLGCLNILLTECSAKVDVPDRHDCTPLMYAATLGYTPCIARLVVLGADKDRQDRKGRSASHLAASKGVVSLVQCHFHQITSVDYAFKGQTESIVELEEMGSNIWLRNLRGDMSIHEAAQGGYIGVIDFLLKEKPEAINAVNRDGRSCLHIAALAKDFALCQYLVDKDIKINLVMQNSKRQYFTALDLANAKNNSEMIKYLRLHGATDAARLTKASAARIQRFLSRYRKPGFARQTSLQTDPNKILEDAFETGLITPSDSQLTTTSMENTDIDSLHSGSADDNVDDELDIAESGNFEINTSTLISLPPELTSDPTFVRAVVAKELHSEYDEIMEASVMGDLKNYSRRSSYAERTSLLSPRTEVHSEALPAENVITRTVTAPTPTENQRPHERNRPRQLFSQPMLSASKPVRLPNAPIFEMSALTLEDEEKHTRRTQSARSAVKYESDSDDDMKHPTLRMRASIPGNSERDGSLSPPAVSLTGLMFGGMGGSNISTSTPALATDPSTQPAIPKKRKSVVKNSLTNPHNSGSPDERTRVFQTDMSDRNPSKSLLDSTHATIPTTSAAAIDGAMESQAHHIKPLETACPSPPHGEHFTIEKTNPTENLTTTSAQLNDGSVQTGTGSPRIKNPQDGLNTPVEISSDQPVLPRNEFGRTAMDDGYFKQEINNEPESTIGSTEREILKTAVTTTPSKPGTETAEPEPRENHVTPRLENQAPVNNLARREESAEKSANKNAATKDGIKQKRTRLRWDQTESMDDPSIQSTAPPPLDSSFQDLEEGGNKGASSLKRRGSKVSFHVRAEAVPVVISTNAEGDTLQNGGGDISPVSAVSSAIPPNLYTRFRPPTPRVPSLHDMEKKTPTVANSFLPRKQFDKKTDLRGNNQKFEVQPNRSRSMKQSQKGTAQGAEGVSGTVAKYLEHLRMIRNKDTQFNEPLVLARLIPKFLKELQNARSNGGWQNDKEMLDTSVRQVRTFSEWEEFLIKQLQPSRISPTGSNSRRPLKTRSDSSDTTKSAGTTISSQFYQSSPGGSMHDRHKRNAGTASTTKDESSHSGNPTRNFSPNQPSASKPGFSTASSPLSANMSIHHPFPWR